MTVDGHGSRVYDFSMFEVTNEIPMPHRRKGKYPWASLDIGDSFFVPAEGFSDPHVARNSLSNGARRNLGPGNFTCAVRTEGNPPIIGVRVWRTG